MADAGDGKWMPGTFLIAEFGGGVSKGRGLLYRGLAIRMSMKGSPKGRRPPTWTLYHVGSGHVVCNVEAPAETAMLIATEVAEVGDWSFEGLLGYVNVDPEIRERTLDVLSRYPKAIKRGGGCPNETAARAVAMARA
jgi:hypothetical protein